MPRIKPPSKPLQQTVHASQLNEAHLAALDSPDFESLRPMFDWISNRMTERRFRSETGTVRRARKLKLALSRAMAEAVVNSPSVERAYSRVNGPARVHFTHIILPVAGLPPSLDGLRVAQITDVHHGPWLPAEYIAAIMQQVNATKPDLVLLTGDYVINSPRYVEPVARAFATLHARIGVFAVLGNHDWWEGAPRMRAALESAGITLIDNRHEVVSPEGSLITSRRADNPVGLAVAGVGDYWEDRVSADDALGGLPEAMPRLLLSHNPDVAEDAAFLAAGHRVDLMISGHTHGGQVRIPRLGTPVIPSLYGGKYASGWVNGPAFPVYVNNGIGTSGVPLRYKAPAEVTLFDLTPAGLIL